MTTTESTATSLEGLLGTVGEAMTGDVLVLDADTPVDVALRRLEHSQGFGGSGRPPRPRGGRGDPARPPRARPGRRPNPDHGPLHRHEHQLTGYRVHQLMTAEPVTARTDWPLAQAVLVMDQLGINRVPVVDSNNRPTGILTRDDVLRALARRIRGLRPPARPGFRIEPD
jgi:CBS domain-containing protein